MIFVIERRVKLGNIGMVQEGLYLDLSHQLIDEVRFVLKDGLFDFFESTNKVSFFMSKSKINYLAR